jgi:hypothetical protein
MPNLTKKDLQDRIDILEYEVSEKDATISNIMANLDASDNNYADALLQIEEIEANRRGLANELYATVDAQREEITSVRNQVIGLQRSLGEQVDVNQALTAAYELVDESFDNAILEYRDHITHLVWMMGAAQLAPSYESSFGILDIAQTTYYPMVVAWADEEARKPTASDLPMAQTCCQDKSEDCCKVIGSCDEGYRSETCSC